MKHKTAIPVVLAISLSASAPLLGGDPTGACCLTGNSCTVTTYLDCVDTSGGIFAGYDTTCASGICDGCPCNGDIGGAFGDCIPDFGIDGNDRFHVADCIAGTNPCPFVQCDINCDGAVDYFDELIALCQQGGGGPSCCDPPGAGACCLSEGDPLFPCSLVFDEASCTTSHNGTFMGIGTTCQPETCAGGCPCDGDLVGQFGDCNPDGVVDGTDRSYVLSVLNCDETCPGVDADVDCDGEVSLYDSEIVLAQFSGQPITDCEIVSAPSGACCFPATHILAGCSLSSQADCDNPFYNGVWQGAGTTCADGLCPVVVRDCADLDRNCIRDDNCIWWEVDNDACVATDIVYADMGGPFGDCRAEGAADGNDRNLALNCFASLSTCEPRPPQAMNVDAGSPFGRCCPDGVCDGNDAFHALNAFAGSNPCKCASDLPTCNGDDVTSCDPMSPTACDDNPEVCQQGRNFVCPCETPTVGFCADTLPRLKCTNDVDCNTCEPCMDNPQMDCCRNDQDTMCSDDSDCQPACEPCLNNPQLDCCANDQDNTCNDASDCLEKCSLVLCPPGGGPQPTGDYSPTIVARADISLVARQASVRPGDLIEVDVFFDDALPDVRGYQLHLGTSGGRKATLELVDIAVEDRVDHVFSDLPFWVAFNSNTGQIVAGLDSDGVPTLANGYLATFVFRPTENAQGRFAIDLLHDDTDPMQRTFLFATPAAGKIAIDRAEPVQIVVRKPSSR